MRLTNYYASRGMMEFRGELAYFIVNHIGGGGFTLPRGVTSVPGEHETPRAQRRLGYYAQDAH